MNLIIPKEFAKKLYLGSSAIICTPSVYKISAVFSCHNLFFQNISEKLKFL